MGIIVDKPEKVLLHSCCAPCSSAIVEYMLNNKIKPFIFYFNPNIYPEEEYIKRKKECMRYAGSLNVPYIDFDYNHDAWLSSIAGLESEPERGKRCLKCFEYRLDATAKYAYENGFTVFTTTLASSRWKDLNQINEAGFAAAAKFPGTVFWDKNWRKGGLSERRSALIKEYCFYNQQYCGCEFSLRKKI